MTTYGEPPVKKTGTRTRASKQKRAEREKKKTKSGQRRQRILAYALNVMEELQINKRQSLALVHEAIERGDLPGPPPAQSTFYKWLERADTVEGVPGVADMLDRPRSGRPRKEWHPEVEDHFDFLITTGAFSSLAALSREISKWANENDLPAPTYWMVRVRHKETDLAVHSTAAHGRAAARADAMPHGTVPAEHTHDVWTLDEMRAPVWVQVYHPVKRKPVSFRPWIILTADNASRAIVSYHVPIPYRNGETEGAFDSNDVLGAFLSAALPDLAESATLEFAGYLPGTVRFDRHAAHNLLGRLLKENAVEAPTLPAMVPYSRGSIESLVGTIKEQFAGTHGHVDQWEPADRAGDSADPRRQRTKSAAKKIRERRRIIREVIELPTISEFKEILDGCVRKYQCRKHRMLQEAPEVAYHRLLNRRKVRNGTDAVFMLQPRVLTVTRGGTEWKNTKFAAEANGRRLAVGDQVVCRPDPLARGLFTEIDEVFHILPTAADWAKRRSGSEVARERAAEVAEYSEAADEALRVRQDDQIAERDRKRSTRDEQSKEPVADSDPEDLGPLIMDGEDELEAEAELEAESNENEDEAESAEAVEDKKVSGGESVPAKGKKSESKKLPRGLVKSRRKHLKLVD